MSKQDKRFKTVYSQGTFSSLQIIVDMETGVKYLFAQSGYASGLTPLLDAEGKPAVATQSELDEYKYI